MSRVAGWLKDNPMLFAVIVVCLTVALVAAMYFGLDLSWIPALLNRLIPG